MAKMQVQIRLFSSGNAGLLALPRGPKEAEPPKQRSQVEPGNEVKRGLFELYLVGSIHELTLQIDTLRKS